MQTIMLEHPFEVIDFLCEEPSDYGISCVGSRAMAGQLSADMLAASDGQGDTLGQALQRLGARPDALAEADRRADGFAAFVELHIEQGPMLERAGLAIGAVTDIVGIRRAQLFFEGQPDHAGTTPMEERSDALVAAATVIRQAQRLARQWSRTRPHYVVATVGRMAVSPNASNTVPGLVDLTLEVRSNHAPVLQEFWEVLARRCDPAIARLGVQWRVEPRTHVDPVPCAPWSRPPWPRRPSAWSCPAGACPAAPAMTPCMWPTAASGMIFIPAWTAAATAPWNGPRPPRCWPAPGCWPPRCRTWTASWTEARKMECARLPTCGGHRPGQGAAASDRPLQALLGRSTSAG
jgi:N-carbamoyl-L-amino-acid hydrolase